MGTGVSPPLFSPGLISSTDAIVHHVSCSLKTAHGKRRSRPRPISTGQLKGLLPLHLRPINQVVFLGSYPARMRVGDLILWWASRLDAFSAYPVRTWLPSGAPGGTTGTPGVRPSRSSRTRDGSTQVSYAHGR